jgi:hypothetical protein
LRLLILVLLGKVLLADAPGKHDGPFRRESEPQLVLPADTAADDDVTRALCHGENITSSVAIFQS